MNRRIDLPHFVVLAMAFGMSVAAAAGLFGTYRSYAGQSPAERLIVLFMFPSTATVMWGVITSLARPKHLAEADDDGHAISRIVFFILMFLCALHAILLAVLFSVPATELWAGRTVVVLVGLIVALISNELPRTRPNAAVGIRTRYTVNDRSLWTRIHRVAGYAGVAVGLITVMSGLLLHGEHVAAVPSIAAVVSVCGIAVYHRGVVHRLMRGSRA